MNHSAEIHQLSVGFQQPRCVISALDKLSFSLLPGETLVLVGESGCGKSLTSLALMRLLPSSGVYDFASRINLDGIDLLDLPEEDMRQIRGRRIAMIFQEPMTALNPVMTIGEQISEILVRHHAFKSEELKDALIDLLIEVEMPNQRKIHQLSPSTVRGTKATRGYCHGFGL